ncbi:cupin domain-containing protein [Dyadobacter sp. CY326]|uniref:cupin domain-containing protein n=1 Tax=Dyadobacter sp. CY326 TaxID=2907300 RepID=UPI001F322947|nr:cupin domain-containing protein [Dyadobacter sp. CY326]MCE7063860.1 cupin domain-containing protein [Dyadobacter sp. CY326]
MAFKNKFIRNELTGQSYRFLQTSADTNGRLLEIETTYEPNGAEPPAHYHPRQAEDFTVLSGELTVRINAEVKLFRKGDRFQVPAGTVHSMWNASKNETKVNWKVEPALDTEYLFETLTGLANEGKTKSNGAPSLLQAVLLVHRFSEVWRLASPPSLGIRLFFKILNPIARLAGYRATYDKYLN